MTFNRLSLPTYSGKTFAFCTLPGSGTRAEIVVPRPVSERIESCPFTNCSLSRMLINPRPDPVVAVCGSNPCLCVKASPHLREGVKQIAFERALL